MKKLSLSLAAMLSVLFVGLSETSWGRGFGGFHGGGMRGGGFHAGGFGGMHAGGFGGGGNFGGMRGGGLGGMGGGMGGGGVRPSEFGGGGGFGDARPDRNFGGAGGFGNAGLAGRGSDRFPGGGAGGFGGRGRGEEGPRAGERELGKTPDRNQLGSFLGLPSDGGMNKLSASHIHVGNTQIGGNQITRNQIRSNRVGRNQIGRDARGMTRYSNQNLVRRGDDVRRDFDGRGYYSADWYRRYPGAWYPRRYAYGNVWTAATWDAMDGWFGYGDQQPVYYDYGNNVTYQNNSVYMDGQDMGTSSAYYDQAQTLAESGSQAQPADGQQWMPLGVFAMTYGDHTKADLILQLAVNKDGVIRGNYTAKLTNDTKPIHGSVDKKTQRAAWTIGDNKNNVIETGIYNLTKDEAPALIHFGQDKTEQCVLVRLDKDGDDGSQGDETQSDVAQGDGTTP